MVQAASAKRVALGLNLDAAPDDPRVIATPSAMCGYRVNLEAVAAVDARRGPLAGAGLQARGLNEAPVARAGISARSGAGRSRSSLSCGPGTGNARAARRSGRFVVAGETYLYWSVPWSVRVSVSCWFAIAKLAVEVRPMMYRSEYEPSAHATVVVGPGERVMPPDDVVV